MWVYMFDKLLPCQTYPNLAILSKNTFFIRDISLTTGGGDRHVRQNSPVIFGDPPYRIGMETDGIFT